jgi:hypothetical protein
MLDTERIYTEVTSKLCRALYQVMLADLLRCSDNILAKYNAEMTWDIKVHAVIAIVSTIMLMMSRLG